MRRDTRDGYYRRYGAPGTPVDEGFYRVYDPLTGADDDDILVPWVNVPQTFTQMSAKEASPTGKAGVSYAMHSVDPMAFDDLAGTIFNYDTQPIYKGYQRLVTGGSINPYDTITGNEPYGNSYDVPGSRWQG